MSTDGIIKGSKDDSMDIDSFSTSSTIDDLMDEQMPEESIDQMFEDTAKNDQV